MSRETKLGLLISLGVILAFAMIISIHLSGPDQHADMGDVADGSHMAQYGGMARTSSGEATEPADPLDREIEMARHDTAPPQEHPDQPTEGLDPDGAATHDPAAYELPVAVDDQDDLVVMTVGQGDAEEPPATEQTAEEPETRDAVQEPEPAPTAPAREYVVHRGDSMYAIAERFYGKGNAWRRIAEANPTVDPNRLTPGTHLVIPGVEPTRVMVADEGPAQPASPDARTYTIVAGDTLGHISQKVYGTARQWQRIVAANPGLAPRSLRVGRVLTIPALETAVATTDAPDSHADLAVADALEEVRRFVSDGDAGEATPHATYRVARGDTLWSISQKTLGSADRWRELLELNHDRLPGPAALRAGQTLRIPATTQTAMAGETGVH